LIVPLPTQAGHPASPVAGLVLRIDPDVSLAPIVDTVTSAGVGGKLLLIEIGPSGGRIVNPSALDHYSAADRDILLARFNELLRLGGAGPTVPFRIATEAPAYAIVRTTAHRAWRLVALSPAARFEHGARQVGKVVLLITLLALAATATGIGLVWWRQHWLQMRDRLQWSEAFELERSQLMHRHRATAAGLFPWQQWP
jgi:hypothetical protein